MPTKSRANLTSASIRRVRCRGAGLAKAPGDDAWLTVENDQVSRCWSHFRIVLVGEDKVLPIDTLVRKLRVLKA